MNICLIYWPAENAQIIDMVAGLPKGLEAWWRVIRVPHQLHDGRNELDTCFFQPTTVRKITKPWKRDLQD